MTTVYLIRHGEAEGNLYRRMQGWYDGDLTDLGRRQVAALAQRFRDIHLDAVYSSDLYRAMETAAALCRPKGLPLFTDPRLREVSVGPWEDEPFGSASAEQPEQFYRFVREPHLWELEVRIPSPVWQSAAARPFGISSPGTRVRSLRSAPISASSSLCYVNYFSALIMQIRWSTAPTPPYPGSSRRTAR